MLYSLDKTTDPRQVSHVGQASYSEVEGWALQEEQLKEEAEVRRKSKKEFHKNLVSPNIWFISMADDFVGPFPPASPQQEATSAAMVSKQSSGFRGDKSPSQTPACLSDSPDIKIYWCFHSTLEQFVKLSWIGRRVECGTNWLRDHILILVDLCDRAYVHGSQKFGCVRRLYSYRAILKCVRRLMWKSQNGVSARASYIQYKANKLKARPGCWTLLPRWHQDQV